MNTQKSSWVRIGYLLGIIGVIQFIILTIIAMLVYPGGYYFSGNFFSNLGQVASANNGMPSMPSRILFIIACTITAIMNIPFILALRTNLNDTKAERIFGWTGTILSIGASPFLFLLSALAVDVYLGPHMLATKLFFLLFGLAIIIYTPALFLNKTYNKILAFYGVLVAIAALLYIFVFIQNAAVQKFTVYFMISWVIVQGVYLWKRKEFIRDAILK
jgi:hypothetical membrane protein